MQPTGWNGQSTPGTTTPPPGWGDRAPGFGNPPPTWGSAVGPGAGTGPDGVDEPRRVGGTIAAHLVLWIGLVAVAALGQYAVRPLVEAGFGYRVTGAVSGVIDLLPVAVALVLAGRSAQLRLLGAAAGVALLVLVVVFAALPPGTLAFELAWVSRIATYVFALGTWMVVRRHARSGYLLLVPLALLLLLWFPYWGPAPDIANLPVAQGIRSVTALSLWFEAPVLLAGLLGLFSSLLRPRPTRSGDALGWLVSGAAFMLVLLAILAAFLLARVR